MRALTLAMAPPCTPSQASRWLVTPVACPLQSVLHVWACLRAVLPASDFPLLDSSPGLLGKGLATASFRSLGSEATLHPPQEVGVISWIVLSRSSFHLGSSQSCGYF